MRRLGVGSSATLALLLVLVACFRGKPDSGVEDDRTAQSDAALAAMHPEEASTELFRSSIEVTALRLKALFPKLDVEREVLGSAPDTSPNQQALARTINTLDRPSGAVAQIVLRKLIGSLCKQRNAELNRTFQEEGLLMSGESFPADAAERAAFSAARNVFLYPYTSDSAEVIALARAYRSVVESGGGVQEARQVVCQAAFLAPQFWLGNGGEHDYVRKVALELGRRLPSFQEYEQAIAGQLSRAALVRKVQAEPGYAQAVRTWHRDWLGLKDIATVTAPRGDKLGVLQYPRGRYRGADSGALGMSGADITTHHVPLRKLDGTTADAVLASRYLHEGRRAPSVEACNQEKPFEQAFDPTTSKIVWEIWNPVVRDWESLGAQVATTDWLCEGSDFRLPAGRDAAGRRTCARWKGDELVARHEQGTWMCQQPGGEPTPAQREGNVWSCPGKRKGEQIRIWSGRSWKYVAGRVSLPKGGSLELTPEDINGIDVANWENHRFDASELPDPEAGLQRTRYQFADWSRLADTHLKYFSDHGLRARRFDGKGREQNGYSAVRLYWSGQTVYVCNAYTRPESTCAYRPPPSLFGMDMSEYDGANNWDARLTETGAFGRSSPGPWRAGFYLPLMNWAGFGFYDIGKASGWVMDNFSCGVPDVAELEKGPRPAGSEGAGSFAREELAFPKGPPYNETAFNVWQTRFDAEGANELELETQRTLMEAVNEEPYRLIEHIVRGNLDYRLLLTSPYTFGPPAYELLLRSQGYFLPAYPPGDYARPGEPAYAQASVRKIQSLPAPAGLDYLSDAAAPSPFVPFSREWLRSSVGFGPGAFGTYDPVKHLFADTPKGPVLKEVRPRPMSGILTMAAFMEPLAPKTRSLSARIFHRLLCNDPSGISLTKEQEEVQERYTSKHPAHLDRAKGCYQCHVNLDPFGKALNNRFLKVDSPKGNDDLEPAKGTEGGELHGTWGINGSSDPSQAGEGAFKGRVVRGVRELARAVADSGEFSSCVVKKHFEALYGRPPAFAEEQQLQKVADSFAEHHNYNRMVEQLVLESASD